MEEEDDRIELAEMAELNELCQRLLQAAAARTVLVLARLAREGEKALAVGAEVQLVAHAGALGAITDPVVDAVADLTASLLLRSGAGEPTEEDVVGGTETLKLCAVALGSAGVLLVGCDAPSDLARARRALLQTRDLILRDLQRDLGPR